MNLRFTPNKKVEFIYQINWKNNYINNYLIIKEYFTK